VSAKWWTRRKQVPVTHRHPETFAIGGYWGNAINWLKAGSKVVGWGRRPQPGDFIKATMQSGRTGLYVVRSSEYERDPRDMFFADVEWHGYAP
jgi:hypothetical protein